MATRELSSTPSLAALYPRAVAGTTVLPLLRKVPGIPRPDGLPDTELTMTGVEVDRENVAAYDRVCGFRLRDELPLTYPHMLTFPLAMQLLTETAFPFGAVGLVHTRNVIGQTRALGIGEPLDLRVWTANLEKGDRGTSFDVLAEVSAGGELVWHSTSTYLHREGGGGDGAKKKPKGDRADPPPPKAVWTVPGDQGRRYAAVSGDRNPIHLYGFSAKLLGMPRAIAHGMWTKARCLAALEGRLPSAVTADVRFKLPVLLPTKVAFSSRPEGDGRAFALHDARSGKPHLEGTALPG